MFKTYVGIEETMEIIMGNANSIKAFGIGTVKLYFTSGRKLIITNFYYVPKIRKFANLLVKKKELTLH